MVHIIQAVVHVIWTAVHVAQAAVYITLAAVHVAQVIVHIIQAGVYITLAAVHVIQVLVSSYPPLVGVARAAGPRWGGRGVMALPSNSFTFAGTMGKHHVMPAQAGIQAPAWDILTVAKDGFPRKRE